MIQTNTMNLIRRLETWTQVSCHSDGNMTYEAVGNLSQNIYHCWDSHHCAWALQTLSLRSPHAAWRIAFSQSRMSNWRALWMHILWNRIHVNIFPLERMSLPVEQWSRDHTNTIVGCTPRGNCHANMDYGHPACSFWERDFADRR